MKKDNHQAINRRDFLKIVGISQHRPRLSANPS